MGCTWQVSDMRSPCGYPVRVVNPGSRLAAPGRTKYRCALFWTTVGHTDGEHFEAPNKGLIDDLVREDHTFAYQDRAPHAIGPRRTLDQMPCVRCSAVSGGARTQYARVPEMRPPHAHRRSRTTGALPGSRGCRGTRRGR